jgi:hypothetical protein
MKSLLSALATADTTTEGGTVRADSVLLFAAVALPIALTATVLTTVNGRAGTPPPSGAVLPEPNSSGTRDGNALANKVVKGLIQRNMLRVDIGLRRAWIEPLLWNKFDAQMKEQLTLLIATYVSPDKQVVEVFKATANSQATALLKALRLTELLPAWCRLIEREYRRGQNCISKLNWLDLLGRKLCLGSPQCR